MTLAGCQRQDEVTETPVAEPSYVLADLALSLPASSARTRLAADVVQADGLSFRGIQQLHLIPFAKVSGKVTAYSQPSYYGGVGIPSIFPKPTDEGILNQFFFYKSLYLMNGVNAFLVYGRSSTTPPPSDDISSKVYNGSLLVKVPESSDGNFPERIAGTPSTLTFELEPIYDETDQNGNLLTPSQAEELATYLTTVAQAQATVGENTVSWRDVEDNWLKLIYMNFVNLGDQEAGVMAGSARNVKAFVNALKTQLSNVAYDEGTIEAAIKENIISRIGTFDEAVYDNYPNGLNLPDGAAAILWNKAENKFEPQTQTSQEVPITTISRFTYPAELFYYSNSLIKTSNEEISDTEYGKKNENNVEIYKTWSDVLVSNLYPYDNATVSGNTKAVAIKEPLQYAVGHLKATAKAKTDEMPDADGRMIPVKVVTDEGVRPLFPIKGIVVSGQRPVNFEFVQTTESANTGYERFAYDGYLGDGKYLTTGGSDTFHTLLLQTKDGEDLTVFLELENNSGQDFKGEKGIIYNGTRFYLMGKIKLEPNAASDAVDHHRRVITQDYTTNITMTVETLAHAYNVMPNILAGRLEIGVVVKLNWIEATPSTVILN